MSKKKKPQPRLVFADEQGNIYDHPDLLMVCRRAGELGLPRPDELVSLPPCSDVFLLPGRHAIGFDEESGTVEVLEETAVAAFVCPGYTLSSTAAYETDEGAPVLPLFAYGAVGFENGRFWVAATKVDSDPRQVFTGIPDERVRKGAQALMKAYPKNRLVTHLATCALTYGCPAAKNLAIGRYEAPLPTSKACNARCLGCISCQPEDSGFPATQKRIGFTPTRTEVVEVMLHHARRAKEPVLSFGQGCEGEPLTEAKLIAEATREFRKQGGEATVNVNTNASLPDAVALIAEAGVDSIRVSLNSAREAVYTAYYRPQGYAFADVVESVRVAKEKGLHVSLNYLFFPGVSDTEPELEALTQLITEHKVDFVQLRNLNIDPELYLKLLADVDLGPAMGLLNFKRRLKKSCPWLGFGYFNPYLGDQPEEEDEDALETPVGDDAEDE